MTDDRSPSRILLIGSGNPDKSRELQVLLAGTSWQVKSLKEYDPVEEPVEDADTFEGNAMLKARYYSNCFGVACVADDSGIVVDGLGGAPGVYSARYAGENCTYDDNNRKLLAALVNTPEVERTARFVCCAAFHDPAGMEMIERGTCEGRIARETRGERGFGYDPLFIPEGHDKTFGEISPEEKHAMSHRGEAFRAMSKRLAELDA